MWTMQGNKRFVWPTERTALSSVVIIAGLSMLIAMGGGPIGDLAFRLSGPTAQSAGEFGGTAAAHPMMTHKRVPLYAFRDMDGRMHVTAGPRERMDQLFPKTAVVLYRPGDPAVARPLGQFDDLFPWLGVGLLLVGWGVRLRLTKPRD